MLGKTVSYPWLAANSYTENRLSTTTKRSLLDQGSLTARLIAAAEHHFEVKLLRQSVSRPSHDEAQLLGLRCAGRAWVREVLLLCDGEPWIYARSVIPLASLKGRLGFLRRLQNDSLGSLLFKDPRLQRDPFEICQLKRSPIAEGFTENQACYGRRSVFHLYKKPILVAEFFLPACKL
jgi:chorismate--pyruvate lyase